MSEDYVFISGDEYWRRRTFNGQFYERYQPAETLLRWILDELNGRPLYVVIPAAARPYPMPAFAEKKFESDAATIYFVHDIIHNSSKTSGQKSDE